jgi:hypothetical protein
MSRTITISDENFRKIQDLAEPLVDSVDSVLARILAAYPMAQNRRDISESTGFLSATLPGPTSIEHTYDPFNSPDLTHTKVTFATVGGKSLGSPNWNSVLDEIIRVAVQKLGDLGAIRNVVRANIVEGQKTTEGYHLLTGTRFSVQGQSANDAWRYIAHIARELQIGVQVRYFWRDKEGAFRPGESGVFVIEGRE